MLASPPRAGLDQPAPHFELPDLEGRLHRLEDQRGRIVVLDFWSCECPHSERTDQAVLAMLVQWGAEVVLWSIASNRNESREALGRAAAGRRLPVVLIDAHQSAADLYGAQTTPHAFVIDRAGVLRYRGAVDDATFRRRTPSRFHLDEAVEALLEGRLPALPETPAYGCAIVREV